MSPDEAETFGLRCLEWLLENDDLRAVFLGATGCAAEDLPNRAGEAEFLAAVLDFLTMDDDWVLAVTASLDCPPEMPLAARAALPGGDLPNWT